MSTLSVFDELDQAIDQMIAAEDASSSNTTSLHTGEKQAAHDPQVVSLLALASDLRQLPSVAFKKRLKAELLWAAQGSAASMRTPVARHNAANAAIAIIPYRPDADVLPSLFGRGYGAYPVQRSNFFASVALHLAAIAAMGAAFWVAQHSVHPMQAKLTDNVSLYVPPLGSIQPHGGGGGGDHSVLPASKGTVVPSMRQQIVPPAAVVADAIPRLTADATVVAPPDIKLPDSAHTGTLEGLLTPSNGGGASSGIGSGKGSGVGSGDGLGIGPGHGAGIGGGYFHVGNGVSAPHAIYDPDPEYSEEARKAHYQGTVIVWAVVGPDGHVHDPHVQRSLGLGLDEKALDAVKSWRFEPATKDGHPVAVQISIEVGFRLY